MRETVRPTAGAGAKFLYRTKFGRLFLPLFTARFLSRAAGAFLDSRLSKPMIKRFIRKHEIRMEDYLPERYHSFNAFFTRKIRPELRPFDPSFESLCSPCDGAATVFPVTREGTFLVKGFEYTVETLLRSKELAERYVGGDCVVIRLTVTDYHRYHFPDSGRMEESRFIRGKLHTVQETALEKKRVFTENCRCVTSMQTDHFGHMTQVEVGAMFVGRIVNEEKTEFVRGEEKGRFEFGGSTVILLFEKDRIKADEEIVSNTKAGLETLVRCGERIGIALKSD